MSSWLVVIGQTVAIGGRAVAHRVARWCSRFPDDEPCRGQLHVVVGAVLDEVEHRPGRGAPPRHGILRHGGECGVHVRGDGHVVEPDDGEVVGHAAPATGRRGHPGDRHQIVGEDDGGRLLTRRQFEEANRRHRATGSTEVAVEGECGRQPEAFQRGAPCFAPAAGVKELVWAADEGDSSVTKIDKVLDGRDYAGLVVEHDGGHHTATTRSPQGHRRQADLDQRGGARIVDAQVGDEHAVDAVIGGKSSIDRQLGVDTRDDLQHERCVASGQFGLDTGDERREERVGAEKFGWSSEHESHRVGPFVGQRSGRLARPPVELARRVEDPVLGCGGDAWPIVEDERHEALGDPGPAGDIDDRGATTSRDPPSTPRTDRRIGRAGVRRSRDPKPV